MSKLEFVISLFIFLQTMLDRVGGLLLRPPGVRGTQYICPTGDVPFFKVSFLLIFLERGSKEGNFSCAGCQSKSKMKFCKIGLLCGLILVFWSIFLTDIFRIRYHLKAKILEQGKDNYFVGTSPCKFRSSIPLLPPGI